MAASGYCGEMALEAPRRGFAVARPPPAGRNRRPMPPARNLLSAFIPMAAPAPAQPQALGIFGSWGAFQNGGRCYGIPQPYEAPPAQGWHAFAAVGRWPAGPGGGQLHVRLSREKRPGSAVL